MSDNREIKKLRKNISELEFEDNVDELWVVGEDGSMYNVYPSGLVVSIEGINVPDPANFDVSVDNLTSGKDEFNINIVDTEVQSEFSEFDVQVVEVTSS